MNWNILSVNIWPVFSYFNGIIYYKNYIEVMKILISRKEVYTNKETVIIIYLNIKVIIDSTEEI